MSTSTRRPLRVGLVGLWHEANSFAPQRVDEDYMQTAGVLRDADILRAHAADETTIAGFVNACASHPDVRLVPLVSCMLTPAGPIDEDALHNRLEEICAAISNNKPFDALLVMLHGAAVATRTLDVDGEILRVIRDQVGPSVQIGVSLDLHANISAEMVANADVLNTYQTNPHVDAHRVAQDLANITIGAARGEVRPQMAYLSLPIALNILSQNTAELPMSDIMRQAEAVRRRHNLLSVSVAEGYPYCDVPEMGMSVVVVADGDADQAVAGASDIADYVWTRRSRFTPRAVSVQEAVDKARFGQGPLLLLDTGDNIGGGAPGDSVVLLRAAIEANLDSFLVIIRDEDSVTRCFDAGVGGRMKLDLGGRLDAATGPPVRAAATVVKLSDGRFEATGRAHAGIRHFNAGRCAVITLSTGQTVLLTSRVVLPVTPAQLTAVDIDPSHFRAIAAKGVHSPLAGYMPFVTGFLRVDTPGVTAADLTQLTYRHRRAPMFPFEETPDDLRDAPTWAWPESEERQCPSRPDW